MAVKISSVLVIGLILHLAASQMDLGNELSFASFVATVAVAVYDLRRELIAGLTGQPDLASLARIAADVRRIDVALNGLNDQFGDSSPVFNLVNAISGNIELELRMEEISEWMHQIDALYDQMQKYIQRPGRYANASIENFALSCVSHNSEALRSLTENIHGSVIGSGFENVGTLLILSSSLAESSLRNVCEYRQSPYQLLYNLMESVMLSEIKGYATIQYAWMLLKIFGHGDFNEEIENAKYKHTDRINATLIAFKNSLKNLSREIITCDNEIQKEGITYERITNFRQGYIENEINVNEKCDSQCKNIKSVKQKRCLKQTLCEKQPKCNGVLNSCREIDGGSNPIMTICLSPKGSTRLYDWIQYDNGIVNGAFGVCKTKRYRMNASWYDFFTRCSYCACICDDKAGPKSDRYFSLKEIVSDVKNNKIVTGLRFRKVNRIITLQISEGMLLPGGIVDKNITWVPIEENVIENQIKDIDYHELTYKERGIDLDDLEGKYGHVLTGVRFKRIKGRLNLQINTTPFDYKTGELKYDDSIWSYSRKSRKRLNIDNRDIPTRSRLRAVPDSNPGQYVEFDHTDFGIDFAQTTIPYIDIQPVLSMNPVLLSGAGIYHKGSAGFGGYISPKIITYNYSPHMTKNFEITSAVML